MKKTKVGKYTEVESSNGHIKYVFYAQDHGGFVCDHPVPLKPNRTAFTGLCLDCSRWLSANIVCSIGDKAKYQK